MSQAQDKIFPAKLAAVSRKALVEAFAAPPGSQAHALGELWKDQQGRTWSPVGRLAWLWLQAPPTATGNFATAVEVLKETNQLGHAWHESFPELPDVVLLWLAHHRFARQHAGLHTRLSSLLHDPQSPIPMGSGVEGDRGWLDRAFTWLGATASEPTHCAPAVLDAVYRQLLRENLQAMEDPYHVWGCRHRATWSTSQGQAVFERLVAEMERLGLDPLPALNTYPLMSACETRFLPAASPGLKEMASAWLPRMVDQALADPDHPYRFPGQMAHQILSWQETGFPECLLDLKSLPATMAHLERVAPDLSGELMRRQPRPSGHP